MRRAALCLLLVAACSSSSALPQGQITTFWTVVDRAAATSSPDVLDRADVVTQLLHGYSSQMLESWQQQLVAADDALYTNALQYAVTLICKTDDADTFTSARSWIVAQGRAVYDRVLASPDALASLPRITDICDGSGEAFGDAATALYSNKGFEPGTSTFPDPQPSGSPTGPSKVDLPALTKRFG